MTDLGPTGTEDDTPLSLEDAAKAFAGTTEDEEPNGSTSTDADPDEPADDTETEVEDEGETDPEGQVEDETEAEPETERGRYVAHNGRVRLPDGTESTVADLIQGNLKDRDYRQKTMEAAEVKKTFETQSSALAQRAQQVDQQAEYVIGLIRSIIPATPNPALADPNSPDYNPAAYMQQEANHRAWSNHLANLEQQRQQTAHEAKSKSDTDRNEKAKTEWESLVSALPELKDDKRLDRFASDVKTYGRTYGFTPEELAQLPFDHRQSVVMAKAIKWDKLQASKAQAQKKVENKPPVQKGGQRLDPQRAKARDGRAAMERLNESGKLKDGVAAYLATLDQG